MTRYRHNDAEVDAWRFDGSIASMSAVTAGHPQVYYQHGTIRVRTPNGNMCAHPGDWIVRDVDGHFFPLTPDVFAATYSPAETTDDR